MAKGFKHGGSGGTSLNFKVVINPQPESAKENTIWVNTDVPIPKWYFSATQPENMAEGEVWFLVGSSSSVAFNALKNNSLQVYPGSAKQYIGGALVDVTAKSWQNGVWVDWFLKIFESGKGALIPMKSMQLSYSSCQITNDAIITTATHVNHLCAAACGTEEPIDLTPFSKLICEANCTSWVEYGAPGIYVGTGGVSVDWGSLGVVAGKNLDVANARVKYELDISNINGEHYVVYWGSANTTIYNIWLE